MKLTDWLRYGWFLSLFLVALFSQQIIRAVMPAPLEYLNLPFPVVHSPVHPGESVVMIVERCVRDVDEPAYLVTRELLNLDTNQRTVLAPGFNRVRLGCETLRAQTAALPDDQEAGRYVYRGVVVMRGRWVTVDVPWTTEPFEIVERR